MSDALSDHQIDFWNRARAFARDEPQRSVRIRGNHYTIWPENDTGARGFGGRPFTIRFLSDGHTVRTTNLWYQGAIPAQYREALPDNAEFITDRS